MILISFIRLTNELWFRIIYKLNTLIMSECKQCKKKPLTSYKTIITIVSVYLLITSVVGTIEIFKYLSLLF